MKGRCHNSASEVVVATEAAATAAPVAGALAAVVMVAVAAE